MDKKISCIESKKWYLYHYKLPSYEGHGIGNGMEMDVEGKSYNSQNNIENRWGILLENVTTKCRKENQVGCMTSELEKIVVWIISVKLFEVKIIYGDWYSMKNHLENTSWINDGTSMTHPNNWEEDLAQFGKLKTRIRIKFSFQKYFNIVFQQQRGKPNQKYVNLYVSIAIGSMKR